ncbi:hypothetical protein [Rhodopila sp.]|uniref:hypothetical protein n=1 Tax=Rhodopila sp. TaxID=2480087 RepID=UPI003D09B710
MIIPNDIYENQVIGCFMTLLVREHGVRYGRAPFEPFGIQLLQQTPDDKPLGDVLISQAKLVRLVEFKRERNKSRKERAKLAVLRPVLQCKENAHLVAISREIHWYIQTNFTVAASSIVVPYLDLENPNGDCDLAWLVEEIGEAMLGPGMSDAELESLQLYMQILATCAGERKPGKRSGALIITSDASGKTQYFPVRDVRELAMTPQQVFREYSMDVQRLKIEQARHMEHRLDQDLRPNHGPSLGL